MGRYVLRRLAITPLLLLGIATVAFIISRLIPADPLASLVGERQMNNEAVVNAAKERWGLDGGVIEQYVSYIRNLVTGDLGTSFRTKNSVASDLWERLPATAELALCALFVAGVGGIALGVVSARRQNKAPDHAARAVALVGSSLPVFWLGLIMLYVFYVRLGWFPGPGRLPPRVDAPPKVTGLYTVDSLLDGDPGLAWECLRQLMLPAIVLGWSLMGTVSRLVRAAMLDELHADYVRTARAKGLRERQVMRHHVLRNALDAGDHDPRPLARRAAHPGRAHRDRVLVERPRLVRGRVDPAPRLPGDQRRVHRRRRDLPLRQPRVRPPVRRRRPEGPLLMTERVFERGPAARSPGRWCTTASQGASQHVRVRQ